MLVKRTSKNQWTLPKVFLEAAGIREEDVYFDAEYDARRNLIFLKPVRVVLEEKIPQSAVERFEKEALETKPGDKSFPSRKEADHFLENRSKK